MTRTQQRNILFWRAIGLLISVSPSAAAENVSLNQQTCFGRVEIYYNNSWGTVCDDTWDMKDSEVLCKQLNCGRALEAPGSARFGTGSGHVWPHTYTCLGDESSLQMCKNESSDSSCGHTQDAGVLCSGALQQPSISLTYPDGGPIISGQADVTEGHRFVFTCSVNSGYTPGVFILKFSGSSPGLKSENTSSLSVSFDFPVADHKDQGDYSCVYEIRLGQTHRSNETERIHIVIKISLLKLLIYSVPAGVALLNLTTLLVVCLVRRRRKRKKLHIIQNQLYTQHCSEKDHEEEEEEADYVNVIPGETQEQTDPTEEVKESDEDGNDYERTEDENDYARRMECCVVVEDEEDTLSDQEESSDDDNDYVNVSHLLPEQDVDIYGKEDIYQNF
nr:scavenger receptor cysteine-rich type 1 protein M130 [Nothobranchius furzeri]